MRMMRTMPIMQNRLPSPTKRSLRLRARHALVWLMIALTASLPALAGPEGENVIAGDVAPVIRDGNATTIVQHSNDAIIEWDDFDIGVNESVEFVQPGDWARVTSPHGEITVPVALQAALNSSTVWTWNAIGKRKGAWALDTDAPVSTRGFLLNHLIHEVLPPKGDGLRWSNSDPVTGQAAWFDLRVRLEKVPAPAEAAPAFPPLFAPAQP